MSERKRLAVHLPGGVCEYCKHFNYEKSRGVFICTSFPDGIPHEIAACRFDHRNPYPGDNEIQFELREGEVLPEDIDELYLEIKNHPLLPIDEAIRQAQERQRKWDTENKID
jgi:hypothetical protein